MDIPDALESDDDDADYDVDDERDRLSYRNSQMQQSLRHQRTFPSQSPQPRSSGVTRL